MNENVEDGGAAFPQSVSDNGQGGMATSYDFVGGEGMTLRDYFAGKALIGLISHHGDGGNNGSITSMGGAADFSYQMADAMLKRRKQ